MQPPYSKEDKVVTVIVQVCFFLKVLSCSSLVVSLKKLQCKCRTCLPPISNLGVPWGAFGLPCRRSRHRAQVVVFRYKLREKSKCKTDAMKLNIFTHNHWISVETSVYKTEQKQYWFSLAIINSHFVSFEMQILLLFL